ncbi:VOC family protein [Actinoplanes sichuanensis]|uniref:VOC family protein n=1 Tax=Actinoplanes sichuanensis TaxID=512349 RepID=A0ABW4AVR0_9ACTN|nr:VOC family protein [Actinoplanes sichuanensis]BEL05457.1 VOC family protein [Actinoplanes sichuanensis]
MQFASVRVITGDVARLTDFYEIVTGRPARRHTPDFSEIVLPGATLAIGGAATVRLFGEGSAEPASNRTAIVEFRVDDVDAEFARLRDTIGEPVQPPTTMPWGNRSLLFRDPDGTLINLFTPATTS